MTQAWDATGRSDARESVRRSTRCASSSTFEAEQFEAGQPRIGPTSQGKQQRGKVLVPRFGGAGSVFVGADDPSDTESANRAPELEKKGGDDSDRDDDDSVGGRDSESGSHINQIPRLGESGTGTGDDDDNDRTVRTSIANLSYLFLLQL